MSIARPFSLRQKLIISSLISLCAFALNSNLSLAQYLSDSTCKSCHLSQWQAWEKSAHRHALKSLPYHEQRNLKCQSCHNEVGVRQLLQRQYRLKSEPKPKVNSPSNIDCITCHGTTQFSVKDQKHQWTDQSYYRVRAQFSCATCHQLPPLDSQKTSQGYDSHSLQAKKP